MVKMMNCQRRKCRRLSDEADKSQIMFQVKRSDTSVEYGKAVAPKVSVTVNDKGTGIRLDEVCHTCLLGITDHKSLTYVQ